MNVELFFLFWIEITLKKFNGFKTTKLWIWWLLDWLHEMRNFDFFPV